MGIVLTKVSTSHFNPEKIKTTRPGQWSSLIIGLPIMVKKLELVVLGHWASDIDKKTGPYL